MFRTSDYDLFLFDFDGLLVNTEELHFAAYRQLCANHGFELKWSLPEFFQAAHFDAMGLRKALYTLFPKLDPNWDVLYAEKKAIYQELLQAGSLSLMPGVEEFLSQLGDARRCVVTNSPRVQVEAIQKKLPVLNSIPKWFTRECYDRPKPYPDGYLKAIEEIGMPGDRLIGFEDSTRGLQSLKAAGVKDAILICPPDHPQIELGMVFYPSFTAFVHN